MRLLIPIIIVLAIALPAHSQPRNSSETSQKSTFSADDQKKIREYFKNKAHERNKREKSSSLNAEDGDDDTKGEKGKRSQKGGKSKSLPQGLSKKGSLPPGLAKQLERNGTLPHGLAKRSMPEDLIRQLSAAGKDQEQIIVDDDVVLIEKTTGKILDIINDIAPGAE